jgi:hypothetical protein
MGWALLERPPVVKLLDIFPAFYGTRRFIALRLSLYWARPIHSTSPHPISSSSILILSIHSVLVFLVVFFFLAFPSLTKNSKNNNKNKNNNNNYNNSVALVR